MIQDTSQSNWVSDSWHEAGARKEPSGEALLPLLREASDPSVGAPCRENKAGQAQGSYLLQNLVPALRLPLRALTQSTLRLLLTPALPPASQAQPRRRGAEEQERGGLWSRVDCYVV
jgi:hypothetical protein